MNTGGRKGTCLCVFGKSRWNSRVAVPIHDGTQPLPPNNLISAVCIPARLRLEGMESDTDAAAGAGAAFSEDRLLLGCVTLYISTLA